MIMVTQNRPEVPDPKFIICALEYPLPLAMPKKIEVQTHQRIEPEKERVLRKLNENWRVFWRG